MKKITTILFVLWITIANAAASQDTTLMRFEGESIAAIEAEGALCVTVRQGEATGVAATLPARLCNQLDIDLREGTLTIRLKGNQKLKRNESVSVDVTCSALRRAAIGGVCTLVIEGDITADSLSLEASGVSGIEIPGSIAVPGKANLSLAGVSSFKGRLLADDLTVDLRGNSSLTLDGEGDTAHILVAGSSQADMDAFPLTEATVEVSGVSKLFLHVTEALRASANGLSRITYSGSPETLDLRTSGMSKITEK